MNLFRLIGDLSHLLAIFLLLAKIWRTRSCAGISGKSQVLFGLVFFTRYLDLATNFVSIYNSVMKVVFITSVLATCYLIFFKFRATYDSNHDAFRAEFLVIPTAGLAVLVNHEFSVLEILWTFSIYLESVAIMPQLFMISKTGEAETIISHYLFALGSYRALYIVNWFYRYYTEGFYDWIAIVAGCVQTALYCGWLGTLKLGVMRCKTGTCVTDKNIPRYSPEGTHHCVWSSDKLHNRLTDCFTEQHYGEVNLDELRAGDKLGMRVTHDRTLEFFVNGRHQGVAAENLYQKGYDVYAVVDHYANCKATRITRADIRLQDICLRKIAMWLRSDSVIKQLPLPINIQNRLRQYMS